MPLQLPTGYGSKRSMPKPPRLAAMAGNSLEHSSVRSHLADSRSHLYLSASILGAPPRGSAEATRTRRVVQAGLSAIFSKGTVLVVNALSVPIAVRYLGVEQFGVWTTIATTLSLLLVLDLGVANVLTNRISEAYARNSRELAARYASSAFWAMVLIAFALGIIGALVYPFVPWASVFHIRGQDATRSVSHAVAVAYAVFLLGLPASLAAKLLGGYQELRAANLFAAAGSIANLTSVILVTRLHGGLSTLVGVSSGAVVLLNGVCLIWIWGKHKPWLAPTWRYCESKLMRQLLSGGSELFVLQLAGLIVFNSDNFVVAHYLGPADVTPYSITWRLVGYAGALQILLTPALWPAYAEAYARGDIRWIRRTLARVMASTMAFTTFACIVLIMWGREIIRIWAGPAAVPDQSLLTAMCGWILISTFMANTATVLVATDQTRLQARLSVIAAALNLVLSVWLVQNIGSVGVILGTIASYIIVLVGPQTWKVFTVLRDSDINQNGHRQ